MAFGFDDAESQPLSGSGEEAACFPEMSLSTRVQGFVLFAILGFFSNSLAWVSLSAGFFWKYAVLMSLGNIMSLCSTMLLMGPRRQAKAMFDETRRVSTIIYLLCLFLTLTVSFTFRSAILCALCCFIQYAAFAWYSLSYIPYGRQVVSACLTTTFGSFFPV